MAEEPQTPPSLEEFRAAQAAQAKKVTPPSLEEFRAAQAAQNGQQPPFAQAPSQQQPPQGGSVGAPAGASPSTSATGGGGAIAAPPAPAMSFSDIDRARAAQLPDEQPTLPPGGAQLAREGIIRKEGQVVSPEEKIAAAPTPTLYPDLNAVRVAKADLLEKVRQQGFADEADMKRNAFYLDEERKLLDGNLKTWQQKLAEHNQRMSDERYRKSRGMGDAIYESVVLPVSGTAQRMALNTVGSTARMLEAVGQLPAAVTGDEPYRSALGELADMASSSVEQAETMESTKTKGALFNEDWEVNKDAFLPQLMRTATYMAGMMGGGLAAGKSGVVAASMLTTEEDYYRDAKEKGLSDQQAQAFAIAGAGMTSALELISPQLYGQGTAKKMLAEKAIQFIKGGATQKQALADAAKFVAEEVGKENVQELSQMLGDKVVEGAANMALGEDRFDTAVSMQEVAETVVMTSILSGLAAGGARAIDRPIRLQSMEWAARNPDAVRKYINEAVPEQQRDNLLERLDVLEKAYNGLPASIQQDEDLERKAEILDAVAEKQEIKAQQKKAVVDETVAALEGDKYEEALSRADARIAAALGATMEKVRAAQERKKMAEKEGKTPQVTKAVPDTPAPTMEWEGAAVQPRQEEQAQPQDGVQQEQITAPAEQAIPQQGERPADAEPQAPTAPTAEEGVAPIANIAPEAIAEIDDVLGITPAAPAEQPEGPVRPEGTGAVPVSERRSKSQPGGRRTILYVKNVQKALSEIAPGLKVIIHNDPAAYRAAIEGYNAKHGTKADPAQSTAIYLPASEEVHLSPSADGQGLAHEAAHPIVSALIAHKPEVFERLYDEIAADPAMAEMLKFGKLYEDQDTVVQKAESIVRLMDAVASGEIKVSTDPKSAWQRFKRWLQDLLASIGFDTRNIDLSDPKNVREFAASFSDAIVNGIKIKKVQGDGARSSAPDLQKDADRLVDGWYSRLNDAVVAKGSTMPASQWKTWLEARAKEGMLSLEEARWTGLSDWLASKGNEKVTPQQVREFLKENRVKVEVKELGGSKPPLEWKRYDLGAAGFYAEANGFRITPGGMGKVDLQGPNSYIGRYDGEEEAREAAEEVHQGSKEHGVTPQFSQYQLPGGRGYREVLVTLPPFVNERVIKYRVFNAAGELDSENIDTREKAERYLHRDAPGGRIEEYAGSVHKPENFRSSHFDEPNILVHLRLNDRVVDVPFTAEEEAAIDERNRLDAERKELDASIITAKRKLDEARKPEEKRIHEEVMEDVKAGRMRLGDAKQAILDRQLDLSDSDSKELRDYRKLLAERDALTKRMPEAPKRRQEKILFIEELQSDWAQKGRREGFNRKWTKEEVAMDVYQRPYETMDEADRSAVDSETEGRNEGTGGATSSTSGAAPLAPFVTSTDAWVELGLKQAIRMAVDGGYDKIAWTTGEQQNERYDLSKQIDELRYYKMPDGTYVINGIKNGTVSVAERSTPEKLPDLIGKDVADRIIKNDGVDGADDKGDQYKSLSGLQLSVGGSGMKGFYDKIIPTVAKKVSKKLGGDGVVGDVTITPNPKGWKITPPDQTTHGQWMVKSSDYNSIGIRADTKEVAERVLADKLAETKQQQQSISITPDMRAKVMSGVPLMQRRDPAEVAAVFAKHGMTADAARAYMQQKGIDPGFAQQVVDAMQQRASAQQPKQPEKAEEKKSERAKRSITKKVVERFPETKDLVTDDMVYYERLPNGTTEAQAIELMSKHGTDSAMAAVMDKSSDMSHAIRMTLGGAVLSRLLEERRYDDFTQFGESFAAMGTELGQGIQALQIVYGRFWTPAIAVRAAQKAVAKAREKRKRAAKKTIDRLKKGLEQENAETAEEAFKAAKVRVKAAKAASSAEPKAEPASYGAKNKVFTRERYNNALKSLRGKLFSGPSPELVDIIGYHIEAGTRSFADIAVKLTRSLGRKVLPYMKEAYTEAAKQAADQGIEFERSTDAEIDEYIFKANTDKAVEKLRKAIERKNKKEADAAIAELQQVSKDYGLWGQYREYAIDRLKRMQLQEIKQDIEADPPLREFTDALVRNLSAQAREAAEEAGLEKPEPKKRRDDIEVIADAYKNFERYKEVWEATRREMQAPYFAAMARAEKAETPEARAEAQDAIQRERAKLERLDNYFGEVGPKPFAESIMAKAVKDGMKALDQKIEEIIKKHYTEYDSAKRSLQTKLVELAGLDGKEAEELASAVGAEFDRIATEKKRRFIRSVLPATDKVARKRKVKAVEDELVALTNAGAFSDDDFIKAYGEKMGWPKLTRENIQEIERLAERVQTSPEGRPRVEAIQDLLGYQQSIPGIDAMEIAQSVWYANMLSGFETQEVNVLANFANMLLEASIATGRMASSKEQRKYLAGLWTSMAEGMATGKLEASAVWRTGYDPIRGQIQVPSTLERHTFKGGAKNPANYLKYVRRFMVASDAIFFEGNRSLRAYQLAVRMASADKKLDPSIDVRNRAAELLGQGDAELEQAKMQAQREYDDEVSAISNSAMSARDKQRALKKADLDRRRRVFELTEKKRPEPIAVGAAQFARRATYNYKPEGALGAIANFINLGLQAMPALRYVVPFTNVIANVANETLNYTPVGYIRAVRGASKFRDEFTPDQKADAIWKASIGMATMAALYLLSHPTDDDDDPVIEITANGFGDYRKNEVLREKGWRPYSFRIGKGPYISYQYTPLILAMGFIGNLNDYAKYRKKKVTDGVLNKWSASLGYTSLAFMDMTFLSSMNNVLSAAMDPRNEDRMNDLTRGMAKTARSFVVPNLYTQGAKLVMNLAEIPQKETRGTIAGNLLRDIPVFRAQYQDAVNVLGEPVMPEWGRLASMPQDDPVANFLGDKGIAIVAPHPNTLTYTDGNGDERMYTDKQKHEFYVRRGQYIRSKIESSMDQLGGMEKKRLEKRVARIAADATKRAKMGLLGIQ